jgi:hypothetical protein
MNDLRRESRKISSSQNLLFSHGITDHVEPCPPLYWGSLITHKVGLLCTSDQPVAEASTYTGQHKIYEHKRQTSMPSAGFEPAIPATKRSQTYALDRAANGIGIFHLDLWFQIWPVPQTCCDKRVMLPANGSFIFEGLKFDPLTRVPSAFFLVPHGVYHKNEAQWES